MFNKKNSKSLVSSKVGSLLRMQQISSQDVFKPVEIATIENALKEDLVKFDWLHKLLSSVVENAVCLTVDQVNRSTEVFSKNDGINLQQVKTDEEFLNKKLVLLKAQVTMLKSSEPPLETDLPENKAISLHLEKACLNMLASSNSDKIKITTEGEIPCLIKQFQSLNDISCSLDCEPFILELAISPDYINNSLQFDEEVRKSAMLTYNRLHAQRQLLQEVKKNLSDAMYYFEAEDQVWIDEMKKLLELDGACQIIVKDIIRDSTELDTSRKILAIRIPKFDKKQSVVRREIDEINLQLARISKLRQSRLYV